MKSFILLIIFSSISISAFGQYDYDASEEYPYGKIHPHAPKEVAEYAPLIGESECISISRAPDQTWNPEVKMLWRFKYIMNGMAIQDETLKEDGSHSGSIRQFNEDSATWFVHYYSSAKAVSILPVWTGGMTKTGEIIIYKEQMAPNGMDGFFKISFFDITENSFEWVGAWVNEDKTTQFPTWKISCKKAS